MDIHKGLCTGSFKQSSNIHCVPGCLWEHRDDNGREGVIWHPGTFMITARREARKCAIQMAGQSVWVAVLVSPLVSENQGACPG